MGFANEKDHPEVAPSQYEMNDSYTEASVAADQVQLFHHEVTNQFLWSQF